MKNQAIQRFRYISHFEGASYLILLFIAMPLKYLAEIPEVVSVVGMFHGIFFVAYVAGIVYCMFTLKWRLFTVVQAFLLAFIPFGNFIMEAKLRKMETTFTL